MVRETDLAQIRRATADNASKGNITLTVMSATDSEYMIADGSEMVLNWKDFWSLGKTMTSGNKRRIFESRKVFSQYLRGEIGPGWQINFDTNEDG